MKRFYYGRQTIDDSDIEAVVEVLRSDMITQGSKVAEFEEALAKKCGAKYAVACSSGTAALHLSYMALGITSGDLVVTSANTFASTMNAALLLGATPTFTDINPETFNMDFERVEDSLNGNLKPKVIVPVHFAGLPVDMESIMAIAEREGAFVIEDACHALGATWTSSDGTRRHVGDCSFSDMSVFSFHPVKSITTGEGGAVLTNNENFYDKLLSLRAHGITKELASFECADIAAIDETAEPASWYYEMKALGLNYRITDFQSALGLSQLKKLDGFMSERAKIASIYDSVFDGVPFIKRNKGEEGKESANHLYVVEIPFDSQGVDKSLWFKEMAKIGIMLQVHYIPVHLQPYYREMLKSGPGDFKNTENYYKRAVSLPIYPGLTGDDVNHIAEKIINSLGVHFK
jgi:UDP-4-amino-4,6-dideoxy-N-acetyl-beta-L-altrosamine transaminase